MELIYREISTSSDSSLCLEKGGIMDEEGAFSPLEAPLYLKEVSLEEEEKERIARQLEGFFLTEIKVEYPIEAGSPIWKNGKFTQAEVSLLSEGLKGLLLEKGALVGMQFRQTFLFLEGKQYGRSHYDYEVKTLDSGESMICYTIFRLGKKDH